jgi:hypothetical protein
MDAWGLSGSSIYGGNGVGRVGRWFIDDMGEILTEGARELTDSAALPLEGDNVRDYLIETAGFIHIEQLRRVVRVRFARQSVQRDALIGLLHFLSGRQDGGVIVEHPEQPGAVPLMTRKAQWLAYVQSIIDERSEALAIQSWSLPVALSPFASRWRGAAEICAILDGVQRQRLLDSLFDGKFILARQSGDDGRHRFVAMGHRHRDFDPEFFDSAIGREVSEGHDSAYARWAMQSYDEVQHAGVPLAEDIDARISFPGRRRSLHRYSRVRIPILRDDGQRLTLSAVTER